MTLVSNSTSISQTTNWNLVFLCWLIACSSTLGSLFFSEVMQIAPCILCWYQRIFMYPLVIILLVGLFPLDKSIIKYAFPFALLGSIVALYHNLIYYGFIPENLQPCSQGVSCAEVNLELFGYLTIPLLSLLSFITISVFLQITKRRLL